MSLKRRTHKSSKNEPLRSSTGNNNNLSQMMRLSRSMDDTEWDEFEQFKSEVYPAIFKIYTTSQSYSFELPWQKDVVVNSTGSGVVILCNQEKVILTAAHVVTDATFIQAQAWDDPQKWECEVLSVCHQADLAMLRLKEPKVLSAISPIELADLPRPKDKVNVVGFPIGGEEISVTEGVVSRIEVQTHSHSRMRLLAITVDAAINEGNSGGPVFKGKQLAGIAFQALEFVEGNGQMISPDIIRHFLESVENGKSLDFPQLGIGWQDMQSPLLRQYFQLGPDQTGVLVVSIWFHGPCQGHLQVGDILLEINKTKIHNNGNVLYRGKYRTDFSAVLSTLFVSDSLNLKVLRKGKVMEITIPYLTAPKPLVPPFIYDQPPTFFMYLGMVFQPLSFPYIEIAESPYWGILAATQFTTSTRDEIVVLQQVLSAGINQGYDLADVHVTHFGEIELKNLRHMVEMIENCKNDTFMLQGQNGVRIVLPSPHTVVAKKAQAEIMEKYHIFLDRSMDLIPKNLHEEVLQKIEQLKKKYKMIEVKNDEESDDESDEIDEKDLKQEIEEDEQE